MMETPGSWRLMSKRVMVGGSVLLAIGLMMDQFGWPSLGGRKSVGQSCQEVVRSQATLTQKQLAQLLAVPEGDKKERIREIIKEPYCKLQSLQIRAGATAQREAYPLEFDRSTWLVILYEGEQYTGYRFAVN
jgi:hypothetical protein